MSKLRKEGNQEKKIIHIDMDAFFASVEQHDNPKLRGKPVAVGGSRTRGVVAAASYEARAYGVYSAMPSPIAYRKCPSIIFVKPRFDRYKEVSQVIRNIFLSYTDWVEPLSLDEAFLDVTHNKKGIHSATHIAQAIQKEIKEKTGLTASAGISINKFIAKSASDYNKPNGITLVGPEKVHTYLEQLPIEAFFGIGKVTAEKMRAKGITDGKSLKKWTEAALFKQFGKAGRFYFNMVRGIDHRPVNPNRERKSIGAENTFTKNLKEKSEMSEALKEISETLARRLQSSGKSPKTLTLKVKFNDFSQITRSKTIEKTFLKEQEIFELGCQLLENDINWLQVPSEVRLLGLSLSNFLGETRHNAKNNGQLTINF